MFLLKTATRAIAQIAAALIAVALMAALTRLALLPFLQNLLQLDEATLGYVRRGLMLTAFILGY